VARINKQLGNRVLTDPGQTGNGADRLPLAKQVQYLSAGLSVQPVHG
jgi:hypothetical protein